MKPDLCQLAPSVCPDNGSSRDFALRRRPAGSRSRCSLAGLHVRSTLTSIPHMFNMYYVSWQRLLSLLGYWYLL